MKLVVAVILFACSGCVGNQRSAQRVDQAQPKTQSETVPAKDERRGDFLEVASNNASQQSLTGLGVQIAKIAEVVEASAIRAEANINTRLSNEIAARAELEAQLRAEIRADFKAQAEVTANAIAKISADFDAKLQAFATAQVSAVAGLGNKVESLSQTYSSGRDTNTTQYTKEMSDTMMRAVSGTTQTVLIMAIAAVMICCAAAAVLIFMSERSRARADQRAREARKDETRVIRGGAF